ncbi:non-muscle caldesmon isoform X2 [Pungitius pungitius]|uniref:non-muscle caldesmon isoform X2 n=1 Tax=Pungitius pungitius TaxID=134920 RepID=UPI002E13622A
MSHALLRRNSNKQGLQTLMRLTAQRSVEDAEELEREQRRRARETSRPGEASPEDRTPAEDGMSHGDPKPSRSLALDEDEGFSDWTQRRERQRQQRLQELSQGGEEDEDEYAVDGVRASDPLQRQERLEGDGPGGELERRKDREEKAIGAERMRREEEEDMRKREEVMIGRKEESQRPNTENVPEKRTCGTLQVERRKEVQISYTSKVVLHHEPKSANGDATKEEVTSHKNIKTQRSSRAVESEEADTILETERRLEKIRQGLQQKGNQELEQLRHRQAEAEQELEQLKRRREERRRARAEEQRRREEEEQQRLAREEEERRRMKEDMERRRMEAAERMKSLSTSSVDGDEVFSPFGPKTPTNKISERTESLSRALKKSHSFKKTLVLLPKMDDKMEQYAHAVENSQEVRAVKASLADLPSSPVVVSSKKNLFEAGEAWSQGPPRGPTCKDAEGLKVGVANRITQWALGPCDGGRQSPGKPTDVKPGDVMQKKNMWEGIGDSTGRPDQTAKSSAAGKKYKFVVTGHGKYEKMAVNGADGSYLDDY